MQNQNSKRKIFNFKLWFLVFIFTFLAIIIGFSYYIQYQKQLPRIALVIDDWGYNLNNVALLRSIDIPITLAVLPNLKYSEEIASQAKYKNRQVILHMPMETQGRAARWEKDTLTTKMGEQEILAIFDKALSTVLTAKGISNHMGSKFTSDSGKMNILLKHLKRKKLFFFDSISSGYSVCGTIAAELNVKYAKRDVFLDNINKADYIKGQFTQLIEIAQNQGYAIGTGHDRAKTLEVIKELAPTLKGKFRFIFLSDLAK